MAENSGHENRLKKVVSVIVTTYNSGAFIERTLHSICNQVGNRKHFDIELIVVDDCSTDDTLRVVNKFDLIQLSTVKNSGGPNAGRNIGLSVASGDYICIVDHDDEWKPNRILMQLPFLERVPIVTSGYTIYNHEKKTKIDKISQSKDGFLYFGPNETFLNRLTKSLGGQTIYLGILIYKRELQSILFEENFGMLDFDWVLKLFHGRDSIEVCESLYYRHVDSINLSLNENYRKRDFYYALMSIEDYRDQYPRQVRLSYQRINGTRARYHYLKDQMKLARFYFRRSRFEIKTMLYYLTSYGGAAFVKRRFNIFD